MWTHEHDHEATKPLRFLRWQATARWVTLLLRDNACRTFTAQGTLSLLALVPPASTSVRRCGFTPTCSNPDTPCRSLTPAAA